MNPMIVGIGWNYLKFKDDPPIFYFLTENDVW